MQEMKKVPTVCEDCGKIFYAKNAHICPECHKARVSRYAKERNLNKLGNDAYSKQQAEKRSKPMAKVGIERNGVFVGAMSFPDRKKPCVVVERGNECVVLGSFVDAGRVDLFEQALRDILKRGEN